MRNNVLESDFNKAVEEIKTFLNAMASSCKQRGWSYYTTDNAPETFKALKESAKEKQLPIASYGSDSSIYGADVNALFRFYHDVTHLENNWSFSKDGETKTAEQHIADARKFGLSPLAIQILWADTFGQVQYYFRNKRFINNQLDFVYMCLQVGINRACGINI